MKEIVADQTKCVGGGNCVMLAPKFFTQGENDGLVQIIQSIVSDNELEAVLLAVKSCPGQALNLLDSDA